MQEVVNRVGISIQLLATAVRLHTLKVVIHVRVLQTNL